MSDTKEITAIVDTVGRTVIGIVTDETKTTVTINNPVIVSVQPDPTNGQLQVQTFPYLFMEFIDVDKTQNEWTFTKSAIATSTVKLNAQITNQYHAINNPAAAGVPADEEPEVIQLFGADGEEAE